ncbi:MAG: histidinol dehydrogenase [Solirubrobacterales bacterium]|nr:histidinol dehydrogenase [Solirubrobacterales bacterium]
MKIERIEWDGANAEGLARRVRGMAPPLDEVTEEVTEIIAAVRKRGDEALRELGLRFGEPPVENVRVDPELVAAAPALVPREVREALRVAAANISLVAATQAKAELRPVSVELPAGQRVEVGASPVASAGAYAPGGRGSYPSSVLMAALPARAAGVPRFAVVSPPSAGGRPDDAVLAACAVAGVEEVYSVGGAQAIAALAHGTDAIPAVDVIVGPGNRYVTEAKRLLNGKVGIDGVAGPSELAVVADGTANPNLIALDLCAQAEHGDDGMLAVISPDPALLDAVTGLVEQLAAERPSVHEATLASITAPGLELALSLADSLAPEHLELAFRGADEASARGRVAGCVFVGSGGATAFGDYAAGSNHVLPTGGAARFGRPLGPGAFMRRTAVVHIGSAAAAELAPQVAAIARAEGFPVHGESAQARVKE